MYDEPRVLFEEAIHKCLPVLQPLPEEFVEQYQVWKKGSDSRWHAEFVLRPDMVKVFGIADAQIREVSAAFCESFAAHHPEYAGMVGFQGFSHNWRNNHSQIVSSALRYLWQRHKTFDPDEVDVNFVVREFSDFVDNPTVRFRFQAQLLNFRMAMESISLPGGLVIRRLTEQEVSTYHGGSIVSLGFIRPQISGPHEYVLEGELDHPKLLGSNHPEGKTASDRAKADLDKAMLCLRTFKEGRIGYDYVHFRTAAFCPLGLPSVGCGDNYVPFGRYFLSDAEIEPLIKHATQMLACSDTAMEMACSRLADAENRSKAEDRIVDAVIGMEALLLSALGKEERRSELSFRFSLNFAMLLQTPEERQQAYRVARDLYSLRSTIAHGSSLNEDKIKIAGETLTLAEAGKRATSALRTLIMHFLPQKGSPHKNHEFWQRAYFGFPFDG